MRPAKHSLRLPQLGPSHRTNGTPRRAAFAAALAIASVAIAWPAGAAPSPGFLLLARSGNAVLYASSGGRRAVAIGLNSFDRNTARRLARISSGKRINVAADDAAGLAVSESLLAQANHALRSALNSEDYANYLRVQEAALGEIGTSLQRIRELAVRAGSPLMGPSERAIIQSEMDQYKSGIKRVISDTQFNTMPVLADIALPLDDLLIAKGPGVVIGSVDRMLASIRSRRAGSGARSNRAHARIRGKLYHFVNTVQAESRIRDADIAWETARLHKDWVMVRANLSLMGKR